MESGPGRLLMSVYTSTHMHTHTGTCPHTCEHTNSKHTPHVHVKNSTWYGLSDRITVTLCITIAVILLSSLLPLLVLLLTATEFDFVLFGFYSVTILFYLWLVGVSVPGIGQVLSHWTNIPSLKLMLWDWGLLSSPDWPWIWVLLDDRHSWDDRHILPIPGTKLEFERNSSEPYVSSIQNTVQLPPDFPSLSHPVLILMLGTKSQFRQALTLSQSSNSGYLG